jgi:16S rRNA (cytosine1402-N4)-methyltransferase
MEFSHIPVLLDEVLNDLIREEDHLFVDATIGGGGHGYYALEKFESLRLLGIDADENALNLAGKRLAPFKDRVSLKKGNFRDIRRLLEEESINEIDAVLFDLGISMYQMSGDRGFSFADEGSLDMRIDSDERLTAQDVVNTYDYRTLARIIREYGEEGDGPMIAKAILEARKGHVISNAKELADIVAGAKRGRGKIHPATKTFQAIRIEVNHEFSNMQKGLNDASDMLRKSGRIGVITFHSLEDRMVKGILRSRPDLKVLTKKVLKPTRDELRRNRRARSAKLRIAEKI